MIFRESTGFSRVECQVQQTCAEHLTDETLTPENRDKRIGRSLYRIVKDYDNPPYRWGIFENYNRWETACYACWSTNLAAVIDAFNSITEERALVRDYRKAKKKYPKYLG